MLAISGAAMAAPGDLPQAEIRQASLQLDWHQPILDALRLRIVLAGQEGDLRLRFAGSASVRAIPGAVDGFAGRLELPGSWQLQRGSQLLELGALHWRPLPGAEFRWAVHSADGRLWFLLGPGHPRMAADHGSMRVDQMEWRIGPALAAWLGHPGLLDQSLAEAILDLDLAASPTPSPRGVCASGPNWPGKPIDPQQPQLGSYRADVLLNTLTRPIFRRCRRLGPTPGLCDGPGGQEGEVVFAPDALLANSLQPDTADVPWYQRFQGTFPPYNNDQHPLLIWNLYRMDNLGRLLQIGRSGVKHAFVTINNGCTLGCDPPAPANANNVLYPGCSDVYAAGSNDAWLHLGPRSEVAPAAAIWGRCGSLVDPDCNGVRDNPPDDGYTARMVIRESDIDPALHPGSRYFLDGWYLVRDDINIDNTMGHIEVTPEFFELWNILLTAPFARGPMVERWLAQAPPADLTLIRRWRSAEGQFVLAAWVSDLGNGQWRYRYALSNLDFARSQLDGAPPNQRVLSNRGLSGIRIERSAPTIAILDPWFADGDPASGNDWLHTLSPGSVDWTAPNAASSLDWGTLYSLSYVSDTAPGMVQATLPVQDPGNPDALRLLTLGPGGSLFRDGFE